MFPGAKFVHIHRDPLTVFASSLKMFRLGFEMHSVQRVPREAELVDWIIRQYRTMYDAFFEERALIPAGDYHELAYEDLERDPLLQIRSFYESLNLPDFSAAEANLRKFIADTASYQKNTFRPLPTEVRMRLAQEWAPSFREWGYAAT